LALGEVSRSPCGYNVFTTEVSLKPLDLGGFFISVSAISESLRSVFDYDGAGCMVVGFTMCTIPKVSRKCDCDNMPNMLRFLTL
jgi:hypothetical protein